MPSHAIRRQHHYRLKTDGIAAVSIVPTSKEGIHLVRQSFSVFVCLWAVLLVVDANAGDAKDDAKRLEGAWTVESATHDGKPADLNGEVTFAGDKMTIKPAKGQEQKFLFKVDPSKKPAIMDLAFAGEKPKNAAPGKAIYELNGNLLKLCIGPPGRRPTEISDKGAVLIVMKRKKT